MRTISIMSWMILFCAGCAMAQPAPATQPAENAAVTPQIDQTLDDLDQLDNDLHDFTADVSLTETDTTFGDSSTRAGTVAYLKKADGDASITIIFKTRQVGDAEARPDELDYALNDGWLIERDHRRKLEVNRQIAKPGQKINLLKLGEGPFPLPIGQDKEEVHRLFDVTLIDPADTDPADSVHLRLVPKPGTQFERKFKSMDVWVDQQTKMPRRIENENTSGNTISTTDLSNIQVNPGLDEGDLALPKIDDSDWSRRDEKFEE